MQQAVQALRLSVFAMNARTDMALLQVLLALYVDIVLLEFEVGVVISMEDRLW